MRLALILDNSPAPFTKVYPKWQDFVIGLCKQRMNYFHSHQHIKNCSYIPNGENEELASFLEISMYAPSVKFLRLLTVIVRLSLQKC